MLYQHCSPMLRLRPVCMAQRFQDHSIMNHQRLFALFWSNIRPIAGWDTLELDKILTEEDQLYKSLNTNVYYLFTICLQQSIELSGF